MVSSKAVKKQVMNVVEPKQAEEPIVKPQVHAPCPPVDTV
jgi:hypothetical protein